jgi:hypothetical protein
MKMGLAWGERKRLMRLTGLADELLNATRIPRDPAGFQALDTEIDALVAEVRTVLDDCDARLSEEFQRVVVRPEEPRPPDLRAATLAGWLRAEVHVENLEEARTQMGVTDQEQKRRLTIGFRSRSQVAPRAESTVPE